MILAIKIIIINNNIVIILINSGTNKNYNNINDIHLVEDNYGNSNYLNKNS